jgi:hypothetical protein
MNGKNITKRYKLQSYEKADISPGSHFPFNTRYIIGTTPAYTRFFAAFSGTSTS